MEPGGVWRSGAWLSWEKWILAELGEEGLVDLGEGELVDLGEVEPGGVGRRRA